MVSKIVIDSFIDDFESLRAYCDHISYGPAKNPSDGVVYPGISLEIPDHIKSEVASKVETAIGSTIKPVGVFLRLSTEGFNAPHQAHTDSVMGDYTLIFYLNRINDCIGGTSFVCHKDTGMMSSPINEKELGVWERDHNRFDQWTIIDVCQMRPNRALIFKSDLMHRAEPVGGFGSSSSDGRLILGMFFNV